MKVLLGGVEWCRCSAGMPVLYELESVLGSAVNKWVPVDTTIFGENSRIDQ